MVVAAKWGDWKSGKLFEPRTDVEIDLVAAKLRPTINIFSGTIHSRTLPCHSKLVETRFTSFIVLRQLGPGAQHPTPMQR